MVLRGSKQGVRLWEGVFNFIEKKILIWADYK